MSVFDWQVTKSSFESLGEYTVNPQNVADFVRKVDALEAVVYHEKSRLERTSRTNPGDSQALGMLREFELTVDTECKILISECVERIRPYFKNLPEEWKICLRSLIMTPTLLPDALKLLGVASEKAHDFSVIEADIQKSPEYADSSLLANKFSPDRDKRIETYRTFQGIEIANGVRFESLFKDLHRLRTEAARISGYKTFFDFFQQSERAAERDYDENDIRNLRYIVKESVAPLLQRLRAYRAQKLGVRELHPADFGGRIAKRGVRMKDIAGTLDEIQSVIAQISPCLAASMQEHQENGYYDIASHNEPYRFPYSNYLPLDNRGWMTCWYGLSPDTLSTIIHEIGHSLHWANMPREALFRQHFPSIEYAEFVPQMLEAVVMSRIDAFDAGNDQWFTSFSFLEKALGIMVYRALMDEFQEIIYKTEDIADLNISELYITLLDQYCDGIDYESDKALIGTGWATWQVFHQPFYGIEYTIAWFAALEWYGKTNVDRDQFEQAFKSVQSAPIKQMFADLGINFLPSSDDVQRWVDHIGFQVAALNPA